MDLITLKNIHKTYHVGAVDVPMLKGVSLEIRMGEMSALRGAESVSYLSALSDPSQGNR
jgi:ABC-type lipoprotein export system ATPase subunit